MPSMAWRLAITVRGAQHLKSLLLVPTWLRYQALQDEVRSRQRLADKLSELTVAAQQKENNPELQ